MELSILQEESKNEVQIEIRATWNFDLLYGFVKFRVLVTLSKASLGKSGKLWQILINSE